MARILGIDYGQKRTGLAATDPLQIIVSGIDTVDTSTLRAWLKSYIDQEEVEKIVIGLPKHKDGTFTHLKSDIDLLTKYINKHFPSVAVDYEDEQFTSSDAKSIIFQAGIKKSKRRDKKLVDKVSAILILQKYLNHI